MGFGSDRWAHGRDARNIEIYNSAYRLPWKLISDIQKREQPDVARRLHGAIEHQLSAD